MNLGLMSTSVGVWMCVLIMKNIKNFVGYHTLKLINSYTHQLIHSLTR